LPGAGYVRATTREGAAMTSDSHGEGRAAGHAEEQVMRRFNEWLARHDVPVELRSRYRVHADATCAGERTGPTPAPTVSSGATTPGCASTAPRGRAAHRADLARPTAPRQRQPA